MAEHEIGIATASHIPIGHGMLLRRRKIVPTRDDLKSGEKPTYRHSQGYALTPGDARLRAEALGPHEPGDGSGTNYDPNQQQLRIALFEADLRRRVPRGPRHQSITCLEDDHRATR